MSIVGTVWHPRGPSPIDNGNQRNNGRTNAIAVHPANDQVACTPGGRRRGLEDR